VEGYENVGICGKGDLPAFDLTGSMRPDRYTIKEQRREKGILKKPKRPLQQRGFVPFCRCPGHLSSQ
jgi:hypothetical protein